MASLFGGVSAVLLPYKITLLSNSAANGLKRGRFYYPIKLHYSQTYGGKTSKVDGFTTL